MADAASPGIEQGHFRRLARAYRQSWPVRMCVLNPQGQRQFAVGWWRGPDDAAQQELMRFCVEEGLRWGEPTVSYGAKDRLYWAVPLTHNAQVLGGLVAGLSEADLFPDGTDGPPLNLQHACRELRLLAERENLTNAALLAYHRGLYRREQERAYVLHSVKDEGLGGIRQLYLREEPQLIAAIRAGNRPDARAVLNRILTVMMFYAHDRVDLIKSFFMEMVAAVCRTAVEAGAEPETMLGANFQSMAELGRMQSLEELSPWLHGVLEKTLDAISQHRQSTAPIVVTDALSHMEQNLHRPLTRDGVAEQVCVSPSYFSRLFKEHTGQGFTQALARMRVMRAAELLGRTSMPIAEIAKATGFGGQGYFSKVFHRITGQTPKAYRAAARPKRGGGAEEDSGFTD